MLEKIIIPLFPPFGTILQHSGEDLSFLKLGFFYRRIFYAKFVHKFHKTTLHTEVIAYEYGKSFSI